MKLNIVITKDLKLFPDQIERLSSFGEVVYYNTDSKSEDEWLKRCEGAQIICSWMYGLKSDKVYSLKDVFISLPFVWVDFLDIEKLKERKIQISNAPWCNKEAVVEWIVGMTLYLTRDFKYLIWNRSEDRDRILRSWMSLYWKEVTILWNGHIWRNLAKVYGSLWMYVNIFRRWDDLITKVQSADIVVNCLPLNEETKGLLDKNFFFSLKRGSFFISTSRHEIYDIDAMIEALNSEILNGVADDSASSVAWDTQYPWYKKLLNHPVIVVTPHIAWNTDYEKRKANNIMIDNIEAYLKWARINIVS